MSKYVIYSLVYMKHVRVRDCSDSAQDGGVKIGVSKLL